MKSIFIIILLIAYSSSINEKILYSSPKDDRISGIHVLSNGYLLAGVGENHMKEINETDPIFLLSADNGTTWEPIHVQGVSDKSTFGIASADNVVIAVRGDRRKPQVLRSEDFGKTWNVVLSTEDLRKLTYSDGPLYSVVYHKYEKKFYAFPNAKAIESSDGGLTWTRSHLSCNTYVRNAYYVDKTDEIYFAGYNYYADGLYVYKKGASNTEQLISQKQITSFAYLNDGSMLASEAIFANGPSFHAKKALRKKGRLYISLDATVSLQVGSIVTFVVPPENQFSAYTNANAKILESISGVAVIEQQGDNTDFIDLPEKCEVYASTAKNKIYKSTDNGKSWRVVSEFTGITVTGAALYSPTFMDLGNGLVYISVAGYDGEINRAGMGEILRSDDYGENWQVSKEIQGYNGARFNAVYACYPWQNGLICGGQFSRVIFSLENN